MGHEDQFLPPKLSARSVIRKQTVAATRGNGRDAPILAIRAYESESGTATDARRSDQCILVAPSTLVCLQP